jgi:DNA repair protein RecN (Recombination protein N)
LNKVASGGELSRLMLSLKSLLAKHTSLPTIIFDEIDSGISGDVAAKTGNILELMAENMQVITITHLPQVASKGKSHLFVYKEETGKRTLTKIKSLTKEERVQEIAKMLSAGKVGEAALKNAKELLKN